MEKVPIGNPLVHWVLKVHVLKCILFFSTIISYNLKVVTASVHHPKYWHNINTARSRISPTAIFFVLKTFGTQSCGHKAPLVFSFLSFFAIPFNYLLIVSVTKNSIPNIFQMHVIAAKWLLIAFAFLPYFNS